MGGGGVDLGRYLWRYPVVGIWICVVGGGAGRFERTQRNTWKLGKLF